MANNKNQNLKNAAKVAKKTASVAKKGKRLGKRSGFQKALPYILIFLSIALGLCFAFVGIFGRDQQALLLIQQFFCGLYGGTAYFLPAIFMFTGIIWVILHLKYPARELREGSDKIDAFKLANKKTVTKTVLCFVAFFLLSTIFGIFEIFDCNLDEFVFTDRWEYAADSQEFISGGVIGGAFAYLLSLFDSTISLVLLFILLAITICFIIGLTPSYIYNKIQYRREFAEEIEEYDEEEEERKLEILRQKELERAKKKRQREHLAEQKRQAKEYASAYEFEDEELQPVIVPQKQNAKAKKEEPAPIIEEEPLPIEEEDSILLGGIGIDDDDQFSAPEAPAPMRESHSQFGEDFGGDELFDGAPAPAPISINNDDLLDGIGEEADDEPIELKELSHDEINEDMKNIIPEKAEEVVQEEIQLPYVFPPVDKLSINKNAADPNVQSELQENAKILKDTLKSFNVLIRDINYSRGPTVTRYELKPEVGTKVKSIANLVDDIALNLATSGVRIEAPIPNKPAVGIEVPNRHPETVYLRDLIESPKFTDSKSRATACLGKDIGGNPICFDIAKMPHLLIAGATGMGKSVCINCIIISLLYKARPDEVKLILIDPKKVEFAMYRDIPHLYAPIVSDPKKAAGALASAVIEMERRFELIENEGVRNLEGYNQAIDGDPTKEKLPLIVIIIDELADLMMTAGKDVEACIARLAQKARAAGIHIIIGTQRPSVDVITGLIKANIPSRIACTVASQIDSRTILDMAGAEKLIGRGDMLFAPVGSSKPMRVQGAFVSDSEVEDIVTFVKTHNSTAKYNADFISSMEANAKNIGVKKSDMTNDDMGDGAPSGGGDSKFEEAVKLAIESGKISTSLLQRRLGVGYGRAAKLIDIMEEKGYVSAANGTKPREVLITMNEFLQRKADGDMVEE